MAEIENRGPELSAVAASLCGLAVVATALRCYVRTRLLHAFGTDDWFMIVALVRPPWHPSSLPWLLNESIN